MQYRPQSFNALPPVIKNLLIINGLFFLASVLFEKSLHLDNYLALHHFDSELFRPHQLVTYMFMHSDFWHIFFNMFALFMFGNMLENFWGPKRFLIFYFVTGIGAALVFLGYQTFELKQMEDSLRSFIPTMDPNSFLLYVQEHFPGLYRVDKIQVIVNNIADEWTLAPMSQEKFGAAASVLGEMMAITKNTPMVGASGAVYGILLAFGVLFPNTMLYIYMAIPVKAKWLVLFYGVVELVSGIKNNPADNVAHFAHLGGMLFGFIMIWYWKRNSNHFY